MESIVDILISIYNFFMNNEILGLPLLVWAIIPVVVYFVLDFLGNKGGSNNNEK